VERIVPLARDVSEAEWERMVVDLREVFDARGRTHQEGSSRAWSNGNLQAWLERLDGTARVRLRTVKSTGFQGVIIGSSMVATGIILGSVTYLAKGLEPGAIAGLGGMVAGGLAILGITAVSARQWADRRRQQMNDLAERWLSRR
jgi:hypothetical protein